MKLPRSFALKSNQNNKYLRYKSEKGEGNGFLEFSGEEVMSPYTKFLVEEAEHMKWEGLVHIKCCFNNKYWVRQSADDLWIVGAANEPEEEKSKWSCTLFKPIIVGGTDKMKKLIFSHVQLGHFACLSKASTPFGSSFLAISTGPQDCFDAYTIVDLDSALDLPKLLVFKGADGRYIRTHPYGDARHLVFDKTDKSDQHTWHEVVTLPDRRIQIKAKGHNDEYWSIIQSWPEWVFACTSDANDPNTFFIPIKLEDNVIAIKRISTNMFCRKHSDASHPDFLACDVPTITPDAKLVVEEAIVSRDIYDVHYDLMNAKMGNEYIKDTIEQTVRNDSEETTTVNLVIAYEETKRKTWDASLSLKLSYEANLKAGIPLVAEVNVGVSARFEGKMSWGKTIETKSRKEASYAVPVPPKSKRKASLVVRMGVCDVPFSYTQCDTLYDGRKVTYTKDDGIFKGANLTKLDFEVVEDI